jgi:hypothetical protein
MSEDIAEKIRGMTWDGPVDMAPSDLPTSLMGGQNAPALPAPSAAGAVSGERFGYLRRNEEQGIPLDPYTGVPKSTQLTLSMMRSDADKLKLLQREYGEENVRVGDTGDPIVRVLDENSGLPKDIVAEPLGFPSPATLGIRALGAAPELAGWIVGAKGAAAGKVLPTALRGAGGAAVGGAAKDFGVRLATGLPIQPGEIAAERAKQAVVDVPLAAALGGAAKLIGKVASPFPNLPPATQETRTAQKLLSGQMGQKYPLTPGQATGSKMLGKVETFMEQVPGSSLPFQAIREAQDTAIRNAQAQLTKIPGGLPESQAVGEKAMEIIRAESAGLKSGIESSRGAANKAASQAVEDLATSIAGSGPVDRVAAGSALMDAAHAIKDAWKATTGYKEFFAQPWTHQDQIPMAGLAAKAKAILDSISATEQKAIKSAIRGPSGQPILRTVEGKVTPSSMIPPGTFNRLQWLAEHGDAKASLNALKTWRSEIDDDILRNSPTPGSKNHIWNELRKALTGAMDEGVAAEEATSKVAGLSNQWKGINTAYSQNVERFTQPGIKELFREPEMGLTSVEAIARAVRNPDTYNAYKKFFGVNSPEFRGIQRAVLDDIVGWPEMGPGGLVDIKRFISQFRSAVHEKPEVMKDILGSRGGHMASLVDLLEGANLTGRVDPSALLNLLQQQAAPQAGGALMPSALARAQFLDRLRNLAQSAEADARAYSNRIRQWVSNNELEPDKIRASEFVSKMVASASPQEITEVMRVLGSRDPALVEQIRARAIANVFNEAAPSITPAEPMSSVMAAMRLPKGGRLKEIIGNEQVRKNLIAIIGEDPMQKIQSISALLSSREAAAGAFASAGQLASGSLISKIERMALWTAGKTIGKGALVATLYTKIPQKWLTGQALSASERAGLIKWAVNSEPFLRFAKETFGERYAKNALGNMNLIADSLLRSDGRTNTPSGKDWGAEIKTLNLED